MSKHITRLEISNFKKFDHLIVEDIGQINLITGDNNVGKTSLLEVLLWEPNMKQILSSLSYVFEKRRIQFDDSKVKFPVGRESDNQLTNLIGLVQKEKDKNIDILQGIDNRYSVGFFIENEIVDVYNNNRAGNDLKEFVEKVDLFSYKEINRLSKNWLIFHKSNDGFNSPNMKNGKTFDIEYMVDVTSSYYFDFLDTIGYFPLIRIEDLYNEDIISYYDAITVDISTKEYLIAMLNKILVSDSIKYLEPKRIQGNNIICIATQKITEFHPITFYGDGFVRIVRIILEILLNKDGRLMIDEIETGIHFLRQEGFWRIVMEVAIENNVQIFCTTHSQDCIKSFVAASDEKKGVKDRLRLIELEAGTKDPSKIYASTYNIDLVKSGLESNINMRGGNLYA